MNAVSTFILGAGLLVAQGGATAASFNCHAASLSANETAICSNSELSALDDQLADAYRQVRAKDRSAIASEAHWIKDVRDKCTTSDCLTAAYKTRIAALSGGKLPACPLSEKALVGHWNNTGREGTELDELEFAVVDGVKSFDSWLHQASFAAGTWILQDCVVHVKGAAAGIDYDFLILGSQHGVVRLKNLEDNVVLELRKASGR